MRYTILGSYNQGACAQIYQVEDATGSRDDLIAKIIPLQPKLTYYHQQFGPLDNPFSNITAQRVTYNIYREAYACYASGLLEGWSYNQEKNCYCLIMKKVEGSTVLNKINIKKTGGTGNNLPFASNGQAPEAVNALNASFEAIKDFHKKTGLMHGDPDLGNIIYHPEQNLKATMIDFGLSRYVGIHNVFFDDVKMFINAIYFLNVRNEEDRFQNLSFNFFNTKKTALCVFMAILLVLSFALSAANPIAIVSSLLLKSYASMILQYFYYDAIQGSMKGIDANAPRSWINFILRIFIAIFFGLYLWSTVSNIQNFVNLLQNSAFLEAMTVNLWMLAPIVPMFGVLFYNQLQMLKTVWSMIEEFIDSTITPKFIIDAKIRYSTGKSQDEIVFAESSVVTSPRIKLIFNKWPLPDSNTLTQDHSVDDGSSRMIAEL
jgi:tRNA A-37 threonylcarbamoyl transferase component Bud32